MGPLKRPYGVSLRFILSMALKSQVEVSGMKDPLASLDILQCYLRLGDRPLKGPYQSIRWHLLEADFSLELGFLVLFLGFWSYVQVFCLRTVFLSFSSEKPCRII